MGAYSYYTYGYGFTVNQLDSKTILKFIKNHADAVIDAYGKFGRILIDKLNKVDIDTLPLFEGEWIDNLSYKDFSDLLDALGDISNYYVTNGRDSVAKIMANETDIDFIYAYDEPENHPAILLAERKPWEYSAYERSLTQERMDEILTIYAKELGIDVNIIGPQEINRVA